MESRDSAFNKYTEKNVWRQATEGCLSYFPASRTPRLRLSPRTTDERPGIPGLFLVRRTEFERRALKALRLRPIKKLRRALNYTRLYNHLKSLGKRYHQPLAHVHSLVDHHAGLPGRSTREPTEPEPSPRAPKAGSSV